MSLCFVSCSKNAESDAFSALINSFEVKVGESYYPSFVDNKNYVIDISGVENGSLIKSVRYKLMDGATINPLPEDRINDWQPEEKFILTYGDNEYTYTAVLTDYKEPVEEEIKYSGEATIYPNKMYGRVVKHFCYDLKDNMAKLSGYDKVTLANKLFQEQDLDGLRIPIWGSQNKGGANANGGHPEEGEVDRDFYLPLLNSMNNAKRARGNKDFIIFASKKIEHGENSCPDWVTPNGKNNVDADKYAIMLVDYIMFMKNEGFEIDVLGIDNESINGRSITAEKFAQIVKKIKQMSQEQGFKCPRFIAPETWEPKGKKDDWLRNLVNNNPDCFDIYGVHYYPNKDHNPTNFGNLKYEIELKGNREFWASEPHWNSQKEVDETIGGDMLFHSEKAICTLWDQTDLGMDAFMWWAYGTGTDLRSQLMEIVSTPIHGAQPIEVKDHDGVDIMESNKFQTRAFIDGKNVHLYVLNVCKYDKRATAGKVYENYKFMIDQSKLNGEVKCTQWKGVEESASGYEKKTFNTTVIDENSFSVSIPSRSITYINFTIE